MVAACHWRHPVRGWPLDGAAVHRRLREAWGAPGVRHGERDFLLEVWPATDADSRVPPHWLAAQVLLAEEGADVVAGTVEPDPDELDRLALGHWRSRHDLREDHSHVHGANLGFTVAAYDRVGGFPGAPLHEDVTFVRRARALGLRVRATDRHRVTPSARRTGRSPAGFAAYLRELDSPGASTTGGSADQGKSIQRSVLRQT